MSSYSNRRFSYPRRAVVHTARSPYAPYASPYPRSRRYVQPTVALARRSYRAPPMRAYARDTETKWHDNYKEFPLDTKTNALTGVNFTFTAEPGVTNVLSSVSQGTTATERIGNVVALQSLRCAFVLEAARVSYPGEVSPDTVYLRTAIRLAVVRDLQVNNSLNYIQYSDVFQNTGASPTSEIMVSAPRNIANMGRFQVLYDQTYNLDADDPQLSFIKTINLGDKHLRYNGPAAEALQDKGLYVVMCARLEGLSTLPTVLVRPYVGVSTRLAFKDA